MNVLFAFAGGVVVGAGIVAGLWIRDIEKPWEPTEEDAITAWELACSISFTGRREGAVAVAMTWWRAWRAALGYQGVLS